MSVSYLKFLPGFLKNKVFKAIQFLQFCFTLIWVNDNISIQRSVKDVIFSNNCIMQPPF